MFKNLKSFSLFIYFWKPKYIFFLYLWKSKTISSHNTSKKSKRFILHICVLAKSPIYSFIFIISSETRNNFFQRYVKKTKMDLSTWKYSKYFLWINLLPFMFSLGITTWSKQTKKLFKWWSFVVSFFLFGRKRRNVQGKPPKPSTGLESQTKKKEMIPYACLVTVCSRSKWWSFSCYDSAIFFFFFLKASRYFGIEPGASE